MAEHTPGPRCGLPVVPQLRGRAAMSRTEAMVETMREYDEETRASGNVVYLAPVGTTSGTVRAAYHERPHHEDYMPTTFKRATDAGHVPCLNCYRSLR